MKTAAKVFIIIGMVCTFWLIFPLVVGILALNKINNAKSKEDLTAMAVLTILFCSFLGGILMLCIPDTEFNGGVQDCKADQVLKSDKLSDVAENLTQLKKLLDDSVITQDIYEEKRKKYLETI